MPPLPFYLFAGTGTAIVVMMLSISFMERVQAAGWTRPLIYTGQMALSLYVGHVIIGMGVLELFGLLENQSLLFAVGSALLFSLLAVLFSYFWRKKFKRGPLELVMRFLT